MDELKHLLPSKIFEIVDRAGICTLKQILVLSKWDIKKVTNLSIDDVMLLKNIVSEHVCPKILTCHELLQQENVSKILSGCHEIDRILNDGFRRGTITEIYGESGSGKTQIALQTVANCWPECAVYICTEDLFPSKRFEEIRKFIPNYNPKTDYGSALFIEHITESKDLLSCARVRLPKLLVQNKFNLIVIDSIAAPFRVESTNYIQRAEDMRELAVTLLSLGQEFKLAILCINQVTSAFDSTVEIYPSLGLAWSNLVSTRLYLKKMSKSIIVKSKKSGIDHTSHVRELYVNFSPDAPNLTANVVVTSEGLQGI